MGALIRFLKIKFDDRLSKAAFKHYIIDPLFSNSQDPCQNLRLLLHSILLRRTSKNQSNFTATYKSIPLSFSSQERLLYDKFLEHAKMDIDTLVSTSENTQTYTKLFAMILRLRMLCNLGQFYGPVGSSLSPIVMPYDQSLAGSDLSSELGCDLCQRDESLDLMNDPRFCSGCSRVLQDTKFPSSNSMTENLESINFDLPQSSHPRNESFGVIWPLTKLQDPYQESNMSSKEYPTKLLAVAKNLRDNICYSKRSVNTLSTLSP